MQRMQEGLGKNIEKNRAAVLLCNKFHGPLNINELSAFYCAQKCILCKSCKIVRFLYGLTYCVSV